MHRIACQFGPQINALLALILLANAFGFAFHVDVPVSDTEHTHIAATVITNTAAQTPPFSVGADHCNHAEAHHIGLLPALCPTEPTGVASAAPHRGRRYISIRVAPLLDPPIA